MHARPDLAPVRLLPRSPGVLVAVLLAHAAVIASFLSTARTPEPVAMPQPLFVRLVEPAPTSAPPVATPTPPAPEPPKLVPKPTPTPVAPAPAPQAVATPAPRPVEAHAEPVRAEAATATPSPTPAPVVDASRPAPPPPLVQPRFNADYLDNPKPPYPSMSRRLGEEGEVRLRVLVDAAGNAQQVEVERSSGYPRLDAAALETVKRWRFVPARQGEQAVAATVIVPIQFTLRN